MRRTLFVMVGLLVAVMGLAGCAGSSTYGSGEFSSTDVDRIVKGQTTKAEVIRTFGQPASMTRNPHDGSEMLSYSFIKSTASQRPESYIPVVGAFVGGIDGTATGQVLTITLNERGVVKDYNYSETRSTTDYSMMGGMNSRTIQTR